MVVTIKGWRKAVLLCLGLYAAVLVASPALHHDLACHLKSPAHCTACLANPVAPRAAEKGTQRIALRADPGSLDLPRKTRPALVFVAHLAGRSPPL